jgi:hypothetical protein
MPLLEEFTYIPIPQWPQAFIFSNVNGSLFIQFDRVIAENSYFFILSVSNPRIPSRSFSPQNCRFMFCTRSGSDIFSFTVSYIQNFGIAAKTGDTIHFSIYYFSLLAPLLSGFSCGKAILGAQFPNQITPIPPSLPVNFQPSGSLELISAGGLCYGPGYFCVYSYYSSGFNISLSTDGNSWQGHSTGSVTQLNSICWSGSYFVLGAVWNSVYSLYFSLNGITWVNNPSPIAGWAGPITSNGSFVLIFVFDYPNTIIYKSDFYNNFTQIASVNYRLTRSCAFGAGLFVSIESIGASNRFARSADGISWLVSSPNFEGYFDSLIWSGDRFCAVNLGSSGPASVISFDGITWIPSPQNFDGDIVCIAFGNGLFVGLSGSSGLNRQYQSLDGLNWVSYEFGQNIQARAICFGADNFVFISNSGNPAYFSINS